MNEQNMRFRVGVFALAALILFAILIILFGGVPTLFKAEDRYSIIFDHATGVAPGTPVRRSGVRIGSVEKVELDDATGKVRVTIAIDRPRHLYEDDQPILVHGALSGDTTIDFVQIPKKKSAEPAGQQSRRNPSEIQQVAFQEAQPAPIQGAQPQAPGGRVPVKPGTEFKGTTQADVAAMLQDVSKLTGPAQDAFLEMRKTLDSYQKLTGIMEETLREYRDLAKTTRETLPEIRRTNDEIQVAARNWGRFGERIDILVQTNQDKLIKTLDNMSDTLVRIGSIFNDENQRNLNTTLKNVSAGSKNLESITQNTDELLKESRVTMRRINDSVTQADQAFQNLEKATKPMAEHTNAIMKNLDESTGKLNMVMQDVLGLLRVLNQGDGSFQRFLTDPALYNNLNAASCMLANLFPRMDTILKDFEVFADKLARHPESLGVRGAISPSSGLKESPTKSSYTPHFSGDQH
ncbi:MAG TPA: MlaD family protein [Gemmataceae bacterium]|nr:MlaD family protein [Gemmataceae bacterium]